MLPSSPSPVFPVPTRRMRDDYTVIATIGVALALVVYFVMGDRAAATLDRLKTWKGRDNTAVMAVLCLIIARQIHR